MCELSTWVPSTCENGEPNWTPGKPKTQRYRWTVRVLLESCDSPRKCHNMISVWVCVHVMFYDDKVATKVEFWPYLSCHDIDLWPLDLKIYLAHVCIKCPKDNVINLVNEWVCVQGLTSHPTHKSFWRRVFPGNRLQWYWQPKNKETKHYIHQKHKRKTEKTVLAKKTSYALVWYTFYDLRSGNAAVCILTTPESRLDYKFSETLPSGLQDIVFTNCRTRRQRKT